MVPFLHVCPDYRTSKISGMLLAPLIVGVGSTTYLRGRPHCCCLNPDLLWPRADSRPRPSSPNSRNGGATCPGTSKLSTSLMEDFALGSEDHPANSWPCQSPFRRSGRRRPASVSSGRLPGPASSGICPRGTAGSRSGEGSGSFGPNPVAPRLANPGRRRQILRFTAQSPPGRLCNEPVPAAGIL